MVSPQTKIYGEQGQLVLGNHTVKEAGQKKYGWLTLRDILYYSSNIGATKVAFEMGAPLLRDVLKKFGYGSKTHIDFPGEASGILRPLPWKEHFLSNVSFGHGLTATPLQMVTAYGVIANDGIWQAPRIVKFIEKQGVKNIIPSAPVSARRVLDKETAKMMQFMLASVSPKKAQVQGFPVAGKTGTAQKVDFKKGGYKEEAYISSFAGFVPAHAPRFVIYVAIDEPQKAHYGSQVAAPIFSKIAQYALRKEELAPIIIAKKDVLQKTYKKSPRFSPKKSSKKNKKT